MYKISGEVIHGKKRGRTIGFPTANISHTSPELEDGTYSLNIEYQNTIYMGVGVFLKKEDLFEAHLFDFSGDLYGEILNVYILGKIRGNKKFSNIGELKEQIELDAISRRTTKYLALTFGSFDHTHPGHHYYLSQAQKYADHLVTIVARDNNIEKIKGTPPKYSENQRLSDLQKLGISDEVILGSEGNPLQWIEKYKPSVICLGYDQRGPFLDTLQSEIDRLGLETYIVRIPAHHPETYKSSLLK